MAKLRLALDTLEVQSFETLEIPQNRGTVQGAQVLVPAPSQRQSCAACESGMCLGTLEDACLTHVCNSGFDTRCPVTPPLQLTDGQDTCLLTCLTCVGQAGC